MTKKWLLTAVTAGAIVAIPTLAAGDVISKAMKESRSGQNSAQNSTHASDNRSSGSPANRSSKRSFDENGGQSVQDERGSGNAGRSDRAMTQQKLRNSLRNAGFKDIRVLDAQYLIQARDDDGNTAFMAINPPSVESRRAETSGLNSNADADEGADMSRGYHNEGAGHSRQNAPRSWRNSSADVYNRAYDEGFREGYRRGYDRGHGN